jgi:hypothetical protein
MGSVYGIGVLTTKTQRGHKDHKELFVLFNCDYRVLHGKRHFQRKP